MASSIQEIKKDLEKRDKKELLAYCLRLAKYKKENKELLGFLLFEADDLTGYIEKVKQETRSEERFSRKRMILQAI